MEAVPAGTACNGGAVAEPIACRVAAGEFRVVSAGVAAGMLTGSGLYLSQRSMLEDIRMTRDQASEEMTVILLRSWVQT
jgi:hypothetical protein